MLAWSGVKKSSVILDVQHIFNLIYKSIDVRVYIYLSIFKLKGQAKDSGCAICFSTSHCDAFEEEPRKSVSYLLSQVTLNDKRIEIKTKIKKLPPLDPWNTWASYFHQSETNRKSSGRRRTLHMLLLSVYYTFAPVTANMDSAWRSGYNNSSLGQVAKYQLICSTAASTSPASMYIPCDLVHGRQQASDRRGRGHRLLFDRIAFLVHHWGLTS